MPTNDPNACTASLCGLLEPARRAAGSKSAHQATLLRDDTGDLHPLRRAGGSPFTDPELQALEGRRVNLHGQPRDGYFLIIRIDVLPG